MSPSFFNKEKTTLRMKDHPFFRYSMIAIMGLWVLQVVLPLWRALPLIYGEPTAPLHYNIHIGVDNVGVWWRIFTSPFLGLVIIFVNIVAARMLWKREPMLSYLIISATLFIEFILLLAMVFIVLLNISYG